MFKSIDRDVIEFLADNPNALQAVRHWMQDLENERTRPQRERPQREQAERDRRAALPSKPCPGLLRKNECGNETPGGYMCDDCNAEFSSDPDAYK